MQQPTYIGKNYRTTSKFNNGSRLVLGTSGVGGIWGEVDAKKSIQKVLYALKNGVTAIDTAPSYKDAQKFVGEALKCWDGDLPFISTKVGRLRGEHAHDMNLDYSPDGMKKSFQDSLETLGVDRVDLLFLHEPQEVPMQNIDEIMQTLESFKAEGLTKRLGIGGNPEGEFWNYVSSEYFDVLSSFTKINASNLEGFQKEIPLIQKENIALYAASPLNMGFFGNKFEDYISGKIDAYWIGKRQLESGKKVKKLADEYNISLPELAVRYLFSMKEADRVVIGPRTMPEVKSSLDYWKKGVLPQQLFDEITNVLLNALLEDSNF